MLLYRLAPEGFLAVADGLRAGGGARILYSDPLTDRPAAWRLGNRIELAQTPLLAPFHPGKIVGVGRNFRAHAEELGNPVPAEPLIFLKAPSAAIGPGASIVLPPESERVEFEGEIAVVLRKSLRRASPREAREAILGITCACDVTARDLQRSDRTFARAKSFDTFCPLGPAIRIEPDLDRLEVVTRINGEERQRGNSDDMLFDIVELLVYVSRMMTLEPWDAVLTGTPAGVGPLAHGDRVEVEIHGVGILENPVEGWEQGAGWRGRADGRADVDGSLP